jgi:hypothetical protein
MLCAKMFIFSDKNPDLPKTKASKTVFDMAGINLSEATCYKIHTLILTLPPSKVSNS